MPEQSQNGELAFSGEHELLKDLKTRLAPVWKAAHRVIVAIDQLSRAVENVAAPAQCAVSTRKRQETNRRSRGRRERFCFFDEADADLRRIISVVMERTEENEIDRRPSDLLEIARSVRALPSKIANIEPAQDKDKRIERAALARYLEIRKGRTFTVRIGETDTKVNFDAIGQGHQRRYRFTKCDA
jgi:hypothetical protein